MKIIHAAVHGCSSHMNVHACMHVYYLYWYVLSQKMWSGAKNVWADNFFFFWQPKLVPPRLETLPLLVCPHQKWSCKVVTYVSKDGCGQHGLIPLKTRKLFLSF